MLNNNEDLIQGVCTVQKTDRYGHKGLIIWITGLPSSGKSTLAGALEKKLFSLGWHTVLIDGDSIRKGLNNDLGFSREERSENIRRIGEVAKIVHKAGLICIVSVIAPYQKDRDLVKLMAGSGNLLEIYLECPISVCKSRDPKGLYAKADVGEISHFTGIDDPYEPPINPDLIIDTSKLDVEQCVDKVLRKLYCNGKINK